VKQSIYAVACFLTAVAVVPSNFALAAVFGVVGAVGSEVLRTLTAFFMVDGVLAVCSFEGDCLVDFVMFFGMRILRWKLPWRRCCGLSFWLRCPILSQTYLGGDAGAENHAKTSNYEEL